MTPPLETLFAHREKQSTSNLHPSLCSSLLSSPILSSPPSIHLNHLANLLCKIRPPGCILLALGAGGS